MIVADKLVFCMYIMNLINYKLKLDFVLKKLCIVWGMVAYYWITQYGQIKYTKLVILILFILFQNPCV